MQRPLPGAAMASSPHSSDEATHQDTPSTSMTTFSPDAVPDTSRRIPVKPKLSFGMSLSCDSGSVAANAESDDVFLGAPTPTITQSQLSPTAESFTPLGIPTPQAGAGPATSHTRFESASTIPIYTPATIPTPVSGFSSGPGPIRYQTPAGVRDLLLGSSPDPNNHLMEYQNPDRYPGAVGQHVSTEHQIMQTFAEAYVERNYGPPLRDVIIREGTFSTDNRDARAFAVTNCSPKYPWAQIASLFNVQAFASLQGINATQLARNNLLILSFTDVRDGMQAKALAELSEPSWLITKMTPKDLATNRGMGNVHSISDYEGQVIVTVFYDGHQLSPSRLAYPVINLLKPTLEMFGDVKAMHSLPAPLNSQQHVRQFRVEYFDTVKAGIALRSLQATPLAPDVFVTLDEYIPDVVGVLSTPVQESVRPHTGRAQEMLSATGRSRLPVGHDPHYQQLVRDLSQVDDSHTPRSSLYGTHNQISVDRIQAGLDVRTTVMLRNIPNKVKQGMLKRMLDETSFGAYDFMYLRIDFANNCNVGYAFINFVDPLAIVPFAQAHAGKRWDTCKSHKVAEISYATIQGKDCLVQKFRNSSVMLEDPTYRPKLFITGNGADAGEEEPFPEPDNMSKMRRSLENAEHVGLYKPGHRAYSPPHPSRPASQGFYMPPARATQPSPPPTPTPTQTRPVLFVDTTNPNDPFAGRAQRATNSLFAPRQGQACREEQRRRRSQFDRGTPGAELELSFANIQMGNRLQDPALSPRRTPVGRVPGGSLYDSGNRSLWSGRGY